MKTIIQNYLQKPSLINSIKEYWWYQIKNPTERFFRIIHNFIKNCWSFKKELAEFQRYDYAYNLRLFNKSLILTKNQLKNEHVNKQIISDMERTIELIKRLVYDNDEFYCDLAEKTLNLKSDGKYSKDELTLFFAEISRLENLDREELKELLPKITEWWN